ncbi:velvet factor-domain-containing protein [Melampsora americana]|nr:velvet factor-domain-containing protein [Melampsora americana]
MDSNFYNTSKHTRRNPTSHLAPVPNPTHQIGTQYRFLVNSRASQSHPPYQLVVRQQPSSARICSFKDKIDRRPLDPPPIVEIISPGHEPELHINSNLCLVAHLVKHDVDQEVRSDNGGRCTAGTIVQSPHRLRDLSGQFAVFFAFPDVSIRLEGSYRLQFRLYSIAVGGRTSGPLAKVSSTPFRVMPPKFFPGMASSSELTRHLAEQGFKLRVRKKTRTVANNQSVTSESDPTQSGSYSSSDLISTHGKRKRMNKLNSMPTQPVFAEVPQIHSYQKTDALSRHHSQLSPLEYVRGESPQVPVRPNLPPQARYSAPTIPAFRHRSSDLSSHSTARSSPLHLYPSHIPSALQRTGEGPSTSSVGTESCTPSSGHRISGYFDHSPRSDRLPSSSEMLALAQSSGPSPNERVKRNYRGEIPEVWDKLAF